MISVAVYIVWHNAAVVPGSVSLGVDPFTLCFSPFIYINILIINLATCTSRDLSIVDPLFSWF